MELESKVDTLSKNVDHLENQIEISNHELTIKTEKIKTLHEEMSLLKIRVDLLREESRLVGGLGKIKTIESASNNTQMELSDKETFVEEINGEFNSHLFKALCSVRADLVNLMEEKEDLMRKLQNENTSSHFFIELAKSQLKIGNLLTEPDELDSPKKRLI